MAHRYIQGAEVSDSAEYRVILSTASLDHAAHEVWLSLVRVLDGAIPTGLVKIELLELAAIHVFYLETGHADSVDIEDFDNLADILMQGSGLEDKEEGLEAYGEILVLLSRIFEGYLHLMLHIRKRFKINRESVQNISVQRLTNVVTNDDTYTDDGSSSFVLIMT